MASKDLWQLSGDKNIKKVKLFTTEVRVHESKLKLMAKAVGIKKGSPQQIIETYIKHNI